MSHARTMERSSKLAPLTLVSKYYPVANYSYPRSEGAPTPCNSRRPSNESEDKRASLDSQPSPLSSPPGLIDDRTDSEASADVDDFRYHTHTNELWDSFWKSGHHHILSSYKKKATTAMAAAGPISAARSSIPPMVPEKDYPALIPSPQHFRRRPQGPRSQGSHAWPLSDQRQSNQSRRPSPTYSAFPKIATIPSPSCTRQSSSSQLSTPCENSLSKMDAHCPPQQAPSPRPVTSHHHRPGSPHPRAFSPASLKAFQRPATSHGSRPSSPMDYPYPSPPPTAPLPSLPPICPRSSHLTPRSSNLSQQSHPPTQIIRPYKSTTQLRPPPEPLPVSVFEYDTDSDCDDEDSSATDSPTLSFFRFHRRSQSPNNNDNILTRRRGSASKTVATGYVVDAAATVAKERRKRRKRTNTMDSLPLVMKQSDVLSRMLGRRSR
jgi:Wiskott-Aldrich syndrome protein